MHDRMFVIGALALLFLADPSAAEPPDWVGKSSPRIAQPRIQGGGLWKGRGRARRPRQRWSMDIDRDDDGTIHGRIDVKDSVLLTEGRVEGVISGRRITGTISGEQGAAVAKFYGIITDEGVRGTYVDVTGETGEWFWEDRPSK